MSGLVLPPYLPLVVVGDYSPSRNLFPPLFPSLSPFLWPLGPNPGYFGYFHSTGEDNEKNTMYLCSKADEDMNYFDNSLNSMKMHATGVDTGNSTPLDPVGMLGMWGTGSQYDLSCNSTSLHPSRGPHLSRVRLPSHPWGPVRVGVVWVPWVLGVRVLFRWKNPAVEKTGVFVCEIQKTVGWNDQKHLTLGMMLV